ncbi:MAG: arylsulfatase [Verrucomicrobiota bacterium JB024]|nr:arylsulfatase [Verrucomicrobiota bacterium JB024]
MSKIVAAGLLLLFPYICLRAESQGLTSGESEQTVRPNIILIMVDDMGWSDIGAYGGEIQTPNLDRLADQGLRFTNFYNTSKCFTSRSCLLTGVYAQRTGTGTQPARIQHATTLGEVLKSAGYVTLASGKHHGLDNLYDRGFDHYYGLRDGACNHFNPGLQRPDEPAPAQKGSPRTWVDDSLEFNTLDPEHQDYFPPGFYTTDAFTDKALEYLDHYAGGDKPFFLYLAFTAPHDPLMAWPQDIAKYEGVYKAGYDAIRTARYQRQVACGLIDPETAPLSLPTYVPWDRLSTRQKKEEARRMQVYAAMIDRVDQNIGRILERLKTLGVEKDTLILFCSDNGASAEFTVRGDTSVPIGGQERYASLRSNWANVANTPFRYFKTYSYEGGIRTPLIAYWPGGIVNPGRLVHQPGHLVDFMATFIDLADAAYPPTVNGETVASLEGESFAPLLFDNACPPRGPLFFEWHEGKALIDWPWKLVQNPGSLWELYDLSEDTTETSNLAGGQSNKMDELITLHDAWFQSAQHPLGEHK